MNLTVFQATGLLAACYLIGSIPEAWLIAKAVTGQDLRHLGSGNLGVTNTGLSVARWAGLLVFLLELAKGLGAVLLVRAAGGGEPLVALGLLATVAGARWSIWLKGAGGRGNTAGSGGLLLIDWRIVLGFLVIWLPLRYLLHSSFKATRFTLVAWPLIFFAVTGLWWYALFGAALSLIYLQGQRPATDDHALIKDQWPSLLAFLTGPKRE